MIVLSYHKHITLAGLQLPEQLPSTASPPCQRHDWNLHLLLRNPSPRLVCPSSWFGQRRAATPALWPFSMPVSRLAMGSSKWQGMARVFPLLPPSILAKCSSWWISALFRWRLSLYLYIYSSYMQRFETLHESLLQPACSMAIFKSIVSFGLFWLALDRNFRRATCEKRNK